MGHCVSKDVTDEEIMAPLKEESDRSLQRLFDKDEESNGKLERIPEEEVHEEQYMVAEKPSVTVLETIVEPEGDENEELVKAFPEKKHTTTEVIDSEEPKGVSEQLTSDSEQVGQIDIVSTVDDRVSNSSVVVHEGDAECNPEEVENAARNVSSEAPENKEVQHVNKLQKSDNVDSAMVVEPNEEDYTQEVSHNSQATQDTIAVHPDESAKDISATEATTNVQQLQPLQGLEEVPQAMQQSENTVEESKPPEGCVSTLANESKPSVSIPECTTRDRAHNHAVLSQESRPEAPTRDTSLSKEEFFEAFEQISDHENTEKNSNEEKHNLVP